MNGFRKFSITMLIFAIGIQLNFIDDAFGQDNRLIDLARQEPPHLVSEKDVRDMLAAIDWQKRQCEKLLGRYRDEKHKIRANLLQLTQEVDELQESIPEELRWIDDTTRSKLAGRLMEVIVDSKLELATLDKITETIKLSEQSSHEKKIQQMKIREAKVAMQMAEKKTELTRMEFAKSKKLATTGHKSRSEANMAEYAMEVAMAELETAKLAVEIEIQKSKERQSQRVSEIHNQTEPLRAKIKSAEEILSSFSESNRIYRKIEKIKADQKLWQQDYKLVVEQLSKNSHKMLELALLEGLMNKEHAKAEDE